MYLSTAMHEGFGIVFLEAMDFGIPVVCYDKGGQTDFLKDNLTGRVIALNQTEKFINAVVELIKDKAKINKINEHNKEYVKKFYIRNIAQEYLKIYSDVINKYDK